MIRHKTLTTWGDSIFTHNQRISLARGEYLRTVPMRYVGEAFSKFGDDIIGYARVWATVCCEQSLAQYLEGQDALQNGAYDLTSTLLYAAFSGLYLDRGYAEQEYIENRSIY